MSITISQFSSVNSIQMAGSLKSKSIQKVKNPESEMPASSVAKTITQVNRQTNTATNDRWTIEEMQNAKPLIWYNDEEAGNVSEKTTNYEEFSSKSLTKEALNRISSVTTNHEKNTTAIGGRTLPQLQTVKPVAWYNSFAAINASGKASINTII
jgi:hypothetical protein